MVSRETSSFLAIEHEGHVIGDVSLHLRSLAPATRSVEIGWLLHSDFTGHGLATEAAEAILDVAFEQAGACLVTAVVRTGNDSSSKLALRLGFRLAAQQDETVTYVLSREDHEALEHKPARLNMSQPPTSAMEHRA